MEHLEKINLETSWQSFKGVSKHQIKQAAYNTVQEVLEAGRPLEMAEALSSMELYLKEIRADKKFVDYVREEVGKVDKYTSKSGAKIELAEVGTKYDYSKCADPLYDQLYDHLQECLTLLNEKIKIRETFLKSLPIEGLLVTEEETGETYKIYPPSKSSTSSYKVTLSI